MKTKTIAEQLLVVLMCINTFTSCIMEADNYLCKELHKRLLTNKINRDRFSC